MHLCCWDDIECVTVTVQQACHSDSPSPLLLLKKGKVLATNATPELVSHNILFDHDLVLLATFLPLDYWVTPVPMKMTSLTLPKLMDPLVNCEVDGVVDHKFPQKSCYSTVDRCDEWVHTRRTPVISFTCPLGLRPRFCLAVHIGWCILLLMLN